MNMTNILKFSLLVWFASFVLVGCSGNVIQAPPPSADATAEPYRIGVGDVLAINVWRNEELSRNFGVRPDGYISMPLMGDIKAAGRRPEELAAEIDEAISSVIRNPEVTVMVTNPASQDYRNRVRATGQVGKPTSISYKPGMTVIDLILEAGGISDFGAGNRATLRRKVNGEYKLYAVRLGDILEDGDMSTNFELIPGDVVSVPEKSLLRGEF